MPSHASPRGSLSAPNAGKKAPVIAPASGPAQTVSATVAPEWWHAFGNAQLDALVAEALAHNNDVAVAEASLRQAQEQARATRGTADGAARGRQGGQRLVWCG